MKGIRKGPVHLVRQGLRELRGEQVAELKPQQLSWGALVAGVAQAAV